MKILIFSKNGDSNGLALRFQKEGHKVWMFNEIASTRESMANMVPHVSSMVEGMKEKPDFVLFDREGNGALADRLRKAGAKVCCSCALADKMELDRGFGLDLMKKSGIKIPETEHFNSVQEALAHVKKNPKPYAIKMDGNKGAASSYVAKDDKDMADYIQYQDEMNLIKRGTKFVLQEVVKGVEVSTEVWFSNGKPVLPYNATFETKKFMPGDLGPNTGCETSIMFPYLGDKAQMVQKTIAKIFPFLERERWTGPLDINCIVSEKDHEPYGLEWTVRLGYSAIYAWAAMIEDGVADFFYQLAAGTLQRIHVKHSWGSSLRLSIPPYPFENPEKDDLERELFEETRGQRIKAPESRHWWPLDVQKDAKGRIVSAGVDGTIGECTGVGKSLYDAWRGSQKVFEQVEIPNKQGRLIDGAESAFKRITKMRAWGYDLPKP